MNSAHRAARASGPAPAAAYERWTRACAAAGWERGQAAERVPLREALGRVSAEPVRARWPVPVAACAAMDGIAIRAGAAGPEPDGTWLVPPGGYAWVDTGDPVPDGLDTVVERERVRLAADGTAHVTGRAPAGQHVRASGEDLAAGRLIAAAGQRLRTADIAAAAATGHAALAVARRPAVAIIPTGNEIRPLGVRPEPGQAIDSNSVMLALRTEQAGGLAEVSGVQPDDPVVLAAEIAGRAAAADLVLVIAGSSAGRRDHTAAVLAEVGGLAVRGVAVRPGHPVLLGHARRPGGGARPGTAVPVVGVPGYPLAAAVIFELFAVPMLAALQGAGDQDRDGSPAVLASDWSSAPGVEDWVPVVLARADAGQAGGCGLIATPSRRGAGSISPLLAAGAWWPIPAGRTRFERGDRIEVLPMPAGPPAGGPPAGSPPAH